VFTPKVRCNTSPTYHPQTDAKCERAHFSVHNIITKLFDDKHERWPGLLGGSCTSGKKRVRQWLFMSTECENCLNCRILSRLIHTRTLSTQNPQLSHASGVMLQTVRQTHCTDTTNRADRADRHSPLAKSTDNNTVGSTTQLMYVRRLTLTWHGHWCYCESAGNVIPKCRCYG